VFVRVFRVQKSLSIIQVIQTRSMEMNMSKVRRFSLAITVLVVILAAVIGFAKQNVSAATVCSPATAISVPYAKDGVGDVCLAATSLCTYINSWNLTTLEVNGTAYTNVYVTSSSIAPLNGAYTIHYVSTVSWGHFEIAGTCGGPVPTATTGPSLTPLPGASPTRTQTPGAGPTATFTPTLAASRTLTPVIGPTLTFTRTPTQTGGSTPTSPPSTGTRPQLSSSVAANYTVAKFLGSWTPETVNIPGSPNYTVSASGAYKTVQAAINAAINAGGSTRKYILVSPGTYTELVFVPSGPPITLYGTGAASAVKIQQKTNSPMTGSQYGALVSAGNYTSAGQSWVNGCIAKGSGTIGTTCSSAFVIQNTAFEAKNLTLTNTYAEDNPNSGGQDQAVAAYVAADQVIFDNVYLYGNQDTLWVASAGKRFYARNCYVEGDVDFIFGAGTAVFDGCQINFTAARKNGSTIGAPSTPSGSYGFLFNGGSFTGSNGASGIYFARQWPQGGITNPIGQMIIRGAVINAFIKTSAPWKDWDSSHLVNYGTASSPYLGEYQNSGGGAAK
jgi:pectinesterase